VRDLNNAEKKILSVVEKHGWMVMSVAPRTGSDDPEEWWSYTIGLTKTFEWSEIICFGLGGKVAHPVLNDAIAELQRRSIRPEPGVVLADALDGFDAKLIAPLPMSSDYIGSAIWFSRHFGLPVPPPIVQLAWPDKDGRFPDDDLCAEGVKREQTPREPQ
jgi:hypothetical protein